jgi:hypothetical protein
VKLWEQFYVHLPPDSIMKSKPQNMNEFISEINQHFDWSIDFKSSVGLQKQSAPSSRNMAFVCGGRQSKTWDCVDLNISFDRSGT